MRKAVSKKNAVKIDTTCVRINHVILCDDARQEVSGKEILIGVYNDVLIFPGFPAFMESLYFRISAKCSPDVTGDIRCALVAPNGAKVFEISSTAPPVLNGDEVRIFGMGFRGVPLPEPGTYEIHFGLAQPAEKIWTFVARLPHGELENRRLQPQQLNA